jgi:septum formation protein
MVPRPSLILASTSRYRQQLLSRLKVPFIARAPDCDEDAWRHLPPDEQAHVLAVRKAESIRDPGALVIGSDQVVDLQGTVLPKPGTEQAAIGQLLLLSGRTHRLVTAVAVHQPDSGRTEVATDVHVLTMRALSPAAIAAYVRADAPLDCAGSYRLEGRGIALFDRIEADPETADDTAIIGLPLMKLCRLLRSFGYDVIE